MDEIALCHHVDTLGNEKRTILQLAHINAAHQTGKKNSIDTAILKRSQDEKEIRFGEKVGEIS